MSPLPRSHRPAWSSGWLHEALSRERTAGCLHLALVANLMEVYTARQHPHEPCQPQEGAPRISEYIMTFHVSTGRSASLKLQSNAAPASGSSVGSWYGAT
jgi:hypothetical protein